MRLVERGQVKRRKHRPLVADGIVDSFILRHGIYGLFRQRPVGPVLFFREDGHPLVLEGDIPPSKTVSPLAFRIREYLAAADTGVTEHVDERPIPILSDRTESLLIGSVVGAFINVLRDQQPVFVGPGLLIARPTPVDSYRNSSRMPYLSARSDPVRI